MRKFYKRHPLLTIIFAAFVLRSTTAFYNYTPNGEDDYANAIEPALKLYQTGEPITTEAYRLALLPRIFYAFIAPLRLLSITDTAFLVSWGLFGLGLLSLAGVWAFYRIGEQISPEWGRKAGWLYAGFFVLPFFSTRAFQESITLTTVPLGLYFLRQQNAGYKTYLCAGIFFGLTTIFRFQALLIALSIFFYLLYLTTQKKLRWHSFLGFITGGVLTFILLLSLDLVEGRAPLATPLAYWRMSYADNILTHQYGMYPWYNYLLIMATVLIPPFSFVLLYPFFKGIPQDKLSALCFSIFIFAHSFIGHKLERYVLPALPFFLLLTLQGLYVVGRLKIVRIAWYGFIALNCLLLPITIFSRSQLNIINAAQYLSSSDNPLLLYRIDLWKQAYMTFKKPFPPNSTELAGLLENFKPHKNKSVDLLALGELPENMLAIIRQNGHNCTRIREFTPSWQEKIVIYLNPESNARRNTSVLYLCTPENN